MQQRKSGTPWIVCGVVAFLVICIGGFILLGGVGALAWFGQDPAGLSVLINAPGTASQGQTFDLVLRLSNTSDKALTVSKIELPEDLLNRAAVMGVNPAATGGGGVVYEFSIPLQPGQSQDVVITLQGISTGTVSGDVNVYVGSRYKITTMSFTVTEASADLPVEPTSVVSGEQITPSGDEIAGVPYKAVVQIIAMIDLEGERVPGWTGSGSIVSKDGLVLTNAHVVMSDRYYQVQDLIVALTVKPDELPVPTYYAQVMQVDEALDIAVIRIETDMDGNPVDRATMNLPTVAIGSSESLQLGDALTILGYPTIGGSTITLTRGEVSGFTAEEGYGNRAFIKTSATISGGNSGGLAANAEGKLIGIPTQLGYGGDDQYVDCRVLVDTNRDGSIDDSDNCVPTGGFINALRPLSLAQPLIDAAARGEINIQEGVQGEQGEVPQEESTSLIFEDDFSNPSTGWDDSAWDEGAVHYDSGIYTITVNQPNWLVWSYQSSDVADQIIGVDTQVLQPTGVGDFGIICRYVDENNFYAMEVSEDGYFTVWKKVGGETTFLYDWEYSESIPTSGAFRINAACVSNRLLLGIDDVLLADVTDDSLTTGRYGLIAGTLDPTGLVVGFDNFIVANP